MISVITLSYNSPDLYCAINSLLIQSYENIQYILIDDGSETFDKTEVEDYIKSNQRGNIKECIVIRSDENLGIVKEKNRATVLAKGEYIFNLSGDDCFADADVLTDWVTEFQQTDADVLTAKRMVFDGKLENLLEILPSDEEISAIKQCNPKQLFEFMAGQNAIFGCCTARRKSTVAKFGLLDESYSIIDDYNIVMRMLRHGQKIDFFDRVVVKYRQGGVSYFENVSKQYIAEAKKLFKCEILPYAEDKNSAKKKFDSWLKRLIFERDYAKYATSKEKYKGDKIKTASAYIKLSFQHPIWALKKVLKK